MKTSSKILFGLFLSILLCITIFAIYIASSLSKEKKWRGETVLATEVRQLPHFYQIESTDGIAIEFTQDSVQKVIVSTDSLLLKEVVTEVKEGKLLLHRTQNDNSSERVVVKINADSITSLDISAGSSFTSINQLKGYTLEIDGSSGSYAKGDFSFTKLNVDFSSGSSGEFKGKVDRLEAETSSGSSFTAPNLISTSALVKASSGANMEVNVTGDISVEASSGGSITYIGSPTLKSIDVNSGGNFNKK